ncbi:MAG: RT0821/Lpp0805 family surface protein [Pseudomonadota bacterium]
MTKRWVAAALASATLGLAGCAGEFNRAESGTVIGAVAGGLIGNQFGRGSGRALATAAGAIAGGIIGHEIGRDLDEEDRRMAQAAEYRALEEGPSDRPIRWRNPDSGHYGEVIPRRAYREEERTCREFEHRVWIDGRREVMTGRACRRRDGTWRNVG